MHITLMNPPSPSGATESIHIPLGIGYLAAVLENKGATFIGMGRSAFAYPDAPQELMEKGHLNPKKVCITCSRCSERLRQGYPTGCVIRDKEIYSKRELSRGG